MTKQRIHVIPVGRPEPLHSADLGCWCCPLEKTTDLAIHNAKDGREKWERQGILDRDKQWILAYEDIKHSCDPCNCPGEDHQLENPHAIGTEGCCYTVVPKPLFTPDGKWDTQGYGVITTYSLEKQRFYTELRCGCWKALKGSENSI